MSVIMHTQCKDCSFYENGTCYAGRLEKWNSDLISTDEEGNHIVAGICSLYNQDVGDRSEILIKRKGEIGIAVSFLVIYREDGIESLKYTLQSILDSDIDDKTELKIVCIDSDPYDQISAMLSGKIRHSIMVRADMEEDPRLIMTNAMKKMKNSFVVVIEAGHLVYNTIRENVNTLINDDLKTVSLLKAIDGGFYGCMLYLAKHIEYFAFDDLGVKLEHLVTEVTYI